MKAARDANDHEAMLAAVRVNWRLWTILQAELLDPQCTVPMDIRTDVLSLAQFVDKHSVEIIGKPSPHQLDVLISINRELAGGLLTTPQDQSQEVGEPSPSRTDGAEGGPLRDMARAVPRGADPAAGRASVRIST